MEFLKKYFAVLTGLFVFIVYLFTLAPTVVQIDTGELAGVQATLGIAHPTGYPIFTILGYLFSLIPLPMSKIHQLNLLAAIWCSLGIGVFTYTAKYILDRIELKVRASAPKTKADRKKSRKKEEQLPVAKEIISEGKKYLSAIAGALILAFSATYWFQSTSVEVYSLQVFLFSLIILFLIKSYFSDDENKGLWNSWMIFALILALGFANHMTTLLILPGTAFLYFTKFGFNKSSFKRLGLMIAVFFLLLIILYAYLPLRASQNPLFNWGNPIDMERILRHVSGKQYQSWIFSSTESAKKQLTYFVNNLPSEFSLSLFIIAVGLFASFRYMKKFAWFFLICFIATVAYSINYDINDIDSYFLLAYISLGMFAVFGTLKLITFLKSGEYKYALPAGLIGLFILVQIYIIYPRTSQNGNYAFEDYTKALISSTEKNAIIFSYQWDFFISSSYYFQYVEHYRPDVTIIDKELLRRSWYYNQLDTRYPKLLDGIRTDVNQFTEALKPFERSESYNSNLLENLFRKIMTGLPVANSSRPYYVGPELYDFEMQRGEFVLPQGYNLVPDLFLFKVVKGNEYVPAPDPNYTIKFPKKGNSYTEYIRDFSGKMLGRRAMYELQFNKPERAKVYADKLRKEYPEFPLPAELTQLLN